MTRDLSPLSLVRGLECLQVTSFNDPVSYAIHPAILTLTSLRERSLRALSLELIQVCPALSAPYRWVYKTCMPHIQQFCLQHGK